MVLSLLAVGTALLLLAVLRETSVSDDSASGRLPAYSQHGSTRWPEGAISNWNVSVPAGSADSISVSPGPQKCKRRVVKSKTARFLRKELRPKRPGKSDSGIDGIVNSPVLMSPGWLPCRMATGNMQS